MGQVQNHPYIANERTSSV